VSVIALELERGAPMELTANHRVFSATRNGWVAAGDLQAGEVLQAQEGAVRVRSVHASERGLTSVFNLEVFARHEFFVGEAGVRVHNGYGSAAGGGQGAFSRILGFTERNLQKGFTKHGADFGMTGNWNPSRAADYSRAVNQHINAPGVRSITGTYRGNPVTHYVDPNTGLNVIADQAGNYVSGWRLSAEQLESVLTTGRLF
jgi:hypothetical protein